MIKKLLLVILIFSMLVCAVSAGDLTGAVSLKSGITETTKTKVNITDSKVEYADKVSGISVTTDTKIDGVLVKATDIKVDEKGAYTFTSDKTAVATFKYEYIGNTIKETITLKEDKVLSFPVKLAPGTMIIPWDHGTWKIVNSTNGDTMNGIIAEKPFGIDASGKKVEMNYTYDGSNLNLNYNRTISIFNLTKTIQFNTTPQFDYFEIAYPFIIDPTWTSAGGCWTTMNGVYKVIMWNSTGTTTWTAPAGISSIEYVVVAGGGGVNSSASYTGTGGGGAGGMLNGTAAVTPGNTYLLTVGAGGYNSNGGFSNFSTILSVGGGKGDGNGAYHNLVGSNGGSGGGSVEANGGTGTSGQGYNGGRGEDTTSAGGGGGGAGGAGDNGSTNNGGVGGIGRQNNITGTLTYYAGGGGSYSGVNSGSSGGAGGGGRGGVSSGCLAGTSGTNGLGGGAGGGGCLAAGYNSGGSGVVIISYLNPPPDAPTNVAATDGTSTSEVTVTWTKSTGATNYYVYADGSDVSGLLGDVATYSYTSAPAGTITPGAAAATDGTYIDKVALSVSGQSTSNGATKTYTVYAYNSSGLSAASSGNTGYRGVGSLTYQWYRSSTDTSGGAYGGIMGATTASYDDTAILSIGGGRYYMVLESATGATSALSTANRGSLTPTANFTSNVTNGTVPFTVKFYDNSTNNASSWNWTFGDTGVSSLQNPTHEYTVAGLYNVSLASYNITGSNIITKTFYINATGGTPYAEFHANVTTGTSPLSVHFIDDTNSSAVSWNWTFGDGLGGGTNYSNTQNPDKVFTGVGRYNVSLNATGLGGSNRTNKSYYINVTAALTNPTSYINITPWKQPIVIGQNSSMQLNVRNITAKFIYANISYNKTFVNVISTSNNFTVYPGLIVDSVIDNTSGFVYLNISDHEDDLIVIGNSITPIANIHFKVNAMNSTVSLPFNSATEYLVSGGIESVVTTVPGSINTTDGNFTFYVNIINAATNSLVNTLTTVNTSGSNVTPLSQQSDGGRFAFNSTYGNVRFNVSTDGYYPLSQTILITDNSDKTIRLTPLTGPAQSTWYSPHQVRVSLIDKMYGGKLVGYTINITPLTNTFPTGGTADWLVNVYGTNPGAANDMLNGTLIMNGITASDGAITFTMLSSIGYNVNVKNDTMGIDMNAKLYPIENDYNVRVDTSGTPITTMSDMNATQLTYTNLNSSYALLGLTYKDIGSKTTNVNFTVWRINNNSMLYAIDLNGFGTNTVYANYTIPTSLVGDQYIWKYNATRV